MIVIVIVAFDMTPFGGNIRFYMKWAGCGARPVQVASKPGIAWYEDSPLFSIPRTQVWFCTPIEAERAGYSATANSYTFPHLEAAGEPNPLLQ